MEFLNQYFMNFFQKLDQVFSNSNHIFIYFHQDI